MYIIQTSKSSKYYVNIIYNNLCKYMNKYRLVCYGDCNSILINIFSDFVYIL